MILYLKSFSKNKLLVPRATELENFVPPSNVKVIYKPAATFNEEVIESYLDIMFRDKPHDVLIWDSARCHLTAPVIQKSKDLKLSIIQVPPRLTNLIQPADVCWFADIKKVIILLYLKT